MLKNLLIFPLIAVVFAKNYLQPNECLKHEESLVSENGCFRLTMQSDGNLVIYRQSNGQALWSISKAGTCTNRACMQGDGNFVTYNCQNKATWSSKTAKREGASITLQNDGNLVIYAWNSARALWASRTVSAC